MKSFIIRLKDNIFSSDIAEDCVVEAQKYGHTVQYFDALTGADADNLFLNENIFQYPKKLKHNTSGVKGCFASHYVLWKRCVETNIPFLILEHDAFMIRRIPNNILDRFTDVCKLDSCDPFSENYNEYVSRDNGDSIIDYDLSWGYKKKAAPYGGYFKGAWSYIIKPHAAKKLIEMIKLNGWVPADKQLGQNILRLQSTASTIFRIHAKYNHKNIHDLSLTRK